MPSKGGHTDNNLGAGALDEDFAEASGQYFDNGSGRFVAPHPDALEPGRVEEIIRGIEYILARG